MINTSLYADIEKDKKKLEKQNNPNFAAVIEVVAGKGVKLKVDGEDEARETYYNSVTQVNVGDRVYINYISGTILVIGKLQY